jgi:hypothetical protein
MTQQSIEEWLAAGNQITRCPAMPYLPYARILSLLGEGSEEKKGIVRLCRQCGKVLTGRARQVYCGNSCFTQRTGPRSGEKRRLRLRREAMEKKYRLDNVSISSI